LNALAWVLATHPRAEIRNGPEAVQLAERACQLSEGKQARFWSTLDVAYAETGRFAEAIAAASKAETLAEAAGQTNAAHAAQVRIQSYRQQKPYRP
jgi:Flp pilus assembly protein TadD